MMDDWRPLWSWILSAPAPPRLSNVAVHQQQLGEEIVSEVPLTREWSQVRQQIIAHDNGAKGEVFTDSRNRSENLDLNTLPKRRHFCEVHFIMKLLSVANLSNCCPKRLASADAEQPDNKVPPLFYVSAFVLIYKSK